MFERKFFLCSCSNLDHLVYVEVDDKTWPDSPVIISVRVKHYKRWYQRILPAIRWMFGSGELEWDETLLDADKVKELYELLGKVPGIK